MLIFKTILAIVLLSAIMPTIARANNTTIQGKVHPTINALLAFVSYEIPEGQPKACTKGREKDLDSKVYLKNEITVPVYNRGYNFQIPEVIEWQEGTARKDNCKATFNKSLALAFTTIRHAGVDRDAPLFFSLKNEITSSSVDVNCFVVNRGNFDEVTLCKIGNGPFVDRARRTSGVTELRAPDFSGAKSPFNSVTINFDLGAVPHQ